MCIAILTTPGKTIDEATFRRCWKNNSHGFGMAYISRVQGKVGEVEIDKGYMKEDGAWRAYQRIAEQVSAENPMLLHFRARTVGDVGAPNCHPFKVKGGAMIHNGTFFHDSNSDKSDSRIVAETMHNELTYENLKEHFEDFSKVFGYNRVAFLFKDGKYVIFSEAFNQARGEPGQWCDGIWYSNGGWKGNYGSYYGDGQKPNIVKSAFPDFVEEDDLALAVLDKSLLNKNIK